MPKSSYIPAILERACHLENNAACQQRGCEFWMSLALRGHIAAYKELFMVLSDNVLSILHTSMIICYGVCLLCSSFLLGKKW